MEKVYYPNDIKDAEPITGFVFKSHRVSLKPGQVAEMPADVAAEMFKTYKFLQSPPDPRAAKAFEKLVEQEPEVELPAIVKEPEVSNPPVELDKFGEMDMNELRKAMKSKGLKVGRSMKADDMRVALRKA